MLYRSWDSFTQACITLCDQSERPVRPSPLPQGQVPPRLTLSRLNRLGRVSGGDTNSGCSSSKSQTTSRSVTLLHTTAPHWNSPRKTRAETRVTLRLADLDVQDPLGRLPEPVRLPEPTTPPQIRQQAESGSAGRCRGGGTSRRRQDGRRERGGGSIGGGGWDTSARDQQQQEEEEQGQEEEQVAVPLATSSPPKFLTTFCEPPLSLGWAGVSCECGIAKKGEVYKLQHWVGNHSRRLVVSTTTRARRRASCPLRPRA
jgi:hypothetical protein